ncbi:hypothetical protein, partial [Aeromonas caviae]|uniref:hypothetical protein n=1 Tax=Aeromonas caviae TaxID=648 RepID=UPI001FC8063F
AGTGRASCDHGGPTVVSRPARVKIAVQMDRAFCFEILTCLVIPLFILFLMNLSFKRRGGLAGQIGLFKGDAGW